MKVERYIKPATTIITLENTTLMAGHSYNEADSKQQKIEWQADNDSDSDKITLPHYNIWND